MKGFPAVGFYKPTESGDPLTVMSNFYNEQIPILTAARYKKLSKKHEFESTLYWLGISAVVLLPLAAQYHFSTNFIYGVPASVVKSKSS
jgi:hypothetical protein